MNNILFNFVTVEMYQQSRFFRQFFLVCLRNVPVALIYHRFDWCRCSAISPPLEPACGIPPLQLSQRRRVTAGNTTWRRSPSTCPAAACSPTPNWWPRATPTSAGTQWRESATSTSSASASGSEVMPSLDRSK